MDDRRGVAELVKFTRMTPVECAAALAECGGDVGAAHRVLVYKKNKDRADGGALSAAQRARDADHGARAFDFD